MRQKPEQNESAEQREDARVCEVERGGALAVTLDGAVDLVESVFAERGPKPRLRPPESGSALWLDQADERADNAMEQAEQLRIERTDPAQCLRGFPARERFAR